MAGTVLREKRRKMKLYVREDEALRAMNQEWLEMRFFRGQ
jgi:hypothetical protein